MVRNVSRIFAFCEGRRRPRASRDGVGFTDQNDRLAAATCVADQRGIACASPHAGRRTLIGQERRKAGTSRIAIPHGSSSCQFSIHTAEYVRYDIRERPPPEARKVIMCTVTARRQPVRPLSILCINLCRSVAARRGSEPVASTSRRRRGPWAVGRWPRPGR